MYNKKGILGALFISLLFLLIIILGFTYLKIRFLNGLEFKTGNIIVKLNYDKEKEPKRDEEKSELNITNISIEDENITFIQNNITSN